MGDAAPQDGPVMDDTEEEPAASLISSEQMHAMHAKIDANKDGKISMTEIMAFAHDMRKTMAGKDVHTILGELDTNKDGMLSLDEILDDLAQANDDEEGNKDVGEEQRDHEAARFNAADSDKNGLLSPEELPSLYYPELHDGVLELTAKTALRDRDSNGDGELTPKEFFLTNSHEGPDVDPSEEELSEFSKLDTDHSGTINLQELKPWESGKFHTEQSMKTLFMLADKDHDDLVSADELDKASALIEQSDVHHHLMEWADAEKNHEL